MALEDYLEPEVAVAAAVTAVLFSPRARKIIRRGAVYGMAGLLKAGDAVTAFAGSVRQGVQEAGAARSAPQAAGQAKTNGTAAEPPATSAAHKKVPSKGAAESAGG